MRRGRLLATAIGLALLAGCGGSDGSGPQRATLLLDFTPNAVHAGIFTAVARGYDRDAGVRLRIREPSSSADASSCWWRAARTSRSWTSTISGWPGRRAPTSSGVFALVQRPLASVIAQPRHRPRRATLEGRRVGVTRLPSDDAVLRSIVRGAGGDPGRVRTTTIGFNAVQALLARRIAGATAFWNAEGVALRRRARVSACSGSTTTARPPTPSSCSR